MPLALLGAVAPLVIVLGLWIRMGRPVAERRAVRPAAVAAVAARSTWVAPASRWAGLTEEITRRGGRRMGREPSDAATHRRHLATVWPAAARR